MAKTKESETVLSSKTHIRGRIRGSGGVTIDGHFEGDIEIDGPVTVGEGATVDSPIAASEVMIFGEYTGDIAASGSVRLGASAKVSGDMKGSSFAMAEGASFSGRLDADFELPAELSVSTERKRR
jgi:cytoskeletal protein CcmA (bactofilin family)